VLARFVVFPKRSADFGNRVVSILHALLAMLLAVPALDWTHPLLSVGAANTAAQVSHLGLETVTASCAGCHTALPSCSQTRCMEVSLAYFVYDFLVCLVIDPEPVGVVHHLCTIAGLAVGVLDGKARVPWYRSTLLLSSLTPACLPVRDGARGMPAADGGQQPKYAPQPAPQGARRREQHAQRGQPGAWALHTQRNVSMHDAMAHRSGDRRCCLRSSSSRVDCAWGRWLCTLRCHPAQHHSSSRLAAWAS